MQNAVESSGTTGEDQVVLRTFDDASSSLLDRTPPQYKNTGPINLVRSRKTSKGFFESDARLLRCLVCCSVADYKPYFDVTTGLVVDRLKFAVVGHFFGLSRPVAGGGLDYDLYAPLWLMITLVVECSIVGYFNQSVTNYFKVHEHAEEAIAEAFSMSSLSNLFAFMALFFTASPFFVYLFARLKLLDGETKVLRLFSALGYSYASYVPAIALTLVNIGSLKWLFVGLAMVNQLACLEKQSADLLPRLQGKENEEQAQIEINQLLTFLRGSFLLS